MSGPAGRPRKISEQVRAMIADAAIQNPDISREKLATKLDAEIAQLGLHPPSFETLKKYISEARSARKESILDKPWSIGVNSAFGIPSEMTPTILKYQEIVENLPEEDTAKEPGSRGYLTIRGALWLVELLPAFKERFPEPEDMPFENCLILVVDAYCREEAIHEVLNPGYIFNTNELDAIWFSNRGMSFEERNNMWSSRFITLTEGSEA